MRTAACLTDPSLSDQRVELTKPISLVYVIDDNFDVYGTLDELTLFTNVVNQYVSIIEQYNSLLPFHHAQLQHLFARRWEFAATEQLLDSLKICFVALYGITNKISYKVYKKNGWNPIDSLKKVVF